MGCSKRAEEVGKAKIALDKFKEGSSQGYCDRGERPELSFKSTWLKQRVGGFLNSGVIQ